MRSSFFVFMMWLAAQPAAAEEVWPMPRWERAEPATMGMDRARLAQVRNYALTGHGSGMIVRGGRLVLSWGDLQHRYDLKSSTKSFGATALGLAIRDGKIRLDDRARSVHPELGIPPDDNAKTGWLDEITIRHLATQTAGFEKPGGYGKLLFRPGTRWHYSDAGPNWLAECLTLAYGQDMKELMFDRVFTPLGITPDDLTWRNNSYRPHQIHGIERREFGSGISANVDAMARIGLLYLRGGRWKDQRILSREFIDIARRPVPGVVGLAEWENGDHGNASDHYGLLWWNNADGTLADVPRDAYWSWGLYDSLIVVIPSLDLVIARAGQSWKREEGGGHYDVLAPFLEPIVAAVQSASVGSAAPYPPSRRVVGVNWAPASSIVRRAKGSDNWPITWGSDDAQYTAYGDGRGFEPFVPRKLSLGFARVLGPSENFEGQNIRSPSGEQTGDGPSGKKASGLLMVDGILYLWARNADNAQLAWSADQGETWTWSPWKFTTSFGCPTFIQFGKNYEGARDDHVYIISPDSSSAYVPADRMILARVPQNRIREREAYEFFEGPDSDHQPRWSKQIEDRGAVFTDPGRCGRSSVSYHPVLKRYLWVQVISDQDARWEGGLGLHEAPEPWGPWSTCDFHEQWDVAPGESASLPTKWFSDDGRTVHLVFSGEDCFSVREATLIVREEAPDSLNHKVPFSLLALLLTFDESFR